MVFSSIPVYLDPHNWQQQPNHQHQENVTNNPQLLPPLPPPPQPQASVADRADQLAKISPPEFANLKCPRCESTNTKFCYFNNYSHSQPRHFCKTCKRYWTRGGALRNVPVGGGCKINKKSKRRSRSKSPASTSANPSSSISNPPFMASLQNLSRYGMGNISTNHTGFPIIGSDYSLTAVGGVDQWRLQQFPFLNGFESTTSAVWYPFQSECVEAQYGLVGDIGLTSRVTEIPPVKLEDLNLSRLSPMSVSENNQFYSWTNLSGPPSSSTSHLL